MDPSVAGRKTGPRMKLGGRAIFHKQQERKIRP